MNILRKIRLKQHIIRVILREYFYDMHRFYINCTETELPNYKIERLIGYIITKYHVIEKGLTMPEMRYGFGTETVTSLITACEIYSEKFGLEHCQVEHAVDVLNEYIDVHRKGNFELDKQIIERTARLSDKYNVKNKQTNQTKIREKEYFSKVAASFPDFARSRHSLRNFSNTDIDNKDLIKAVELAQETTPTSCNRQSIRLHIVAEKETVKEVLSLHTGNRGFGHLVNKLILISSEISVYNEVRERNLPYVDCGIYAMNLLYALHYYKIGACALNWSVTVETDKRLRALLDIPASEAVGLIIACGMPASEFSVAVSKRFDIKSIVKSH